jgi:hypothetical protein
MIIEDIGVFAVAPKKDTIETIITDDTSNHRNRPKLWTTVPMNAPNRPPITIEGPKTPGLPQNLLLMMWL